MREFISSRFQQYEKSVRVNRSEVLIIFLFNHPGTVVSEFARKLFLYVYDPGTSIIWYCCPENKVRNGWYPANGLNSLLGIMQRNRHSEVTPDV